MRILWATPFNIRSAIATFSVEVCDELFRRGYDVHVLRIEDQIAAALPEQTCLAPVMPVGTGVPLDVDLAIINYGNHAPYHAGALALAVDRPALAIFHDAEMRHYIYGMEHQHGVKLPLLAGASEVELRPDGFDLVDPASRPLLQSIAAMSCAAVVHGPHYLASVAEVCPGPVENIPLCFPDFGAPHPAPRADGPFRITIFGVITAHKQPDRLIHAVAALQDRFGRIEIHLAGAIEDRDRAAFSALAVQYELDVPIFHNYLSDADMSEVLIRSDVICCLRYPVTEGGSASLITAMYHARPLIVSDVASYSVVPSELVEKVSYGNDPKDLSDSIARILDDLPSADQRALQARDWARDNFSTAAYVDRLEGVIARALSFLPVAEACRALAPTVCYPDGNIMLPALETLGRSVDELYMSRAVRGEGV